jgi:predicted nucleotidyltransferase
MNETALVPLLGRSRIRRAILALLVLEPDRRLHLREIARRAGTSAGTAARELGRLESAGLVERERVGAQVEFRASPTSPLAAPVAELVRRTMGARAVLRDALADLAGIEGARIYGSYAAGRAGPRSDIDLLVVGAPDRDALTERLEGAGRALGRAVNEVVFTTAELEDRRGRRDGFIRSIDDGAVIEVMP